jgi:hypothetical protein
MRAPALVAVALVVLVVGAASFARAGAGSRTLAVNGEIGSISASGGAAAISVDGCRGLVWIPSTGAVTNLRDPCNADAKYQDLTLAGDTAIWWDYDAGNHVYCDDVYTASISSPKAKGLGICDGTMGDTYFELAGDRTIVTISDYTVCESDCTGDNGNLLPDGDYGVEVRRRFPGGKLVPILPATNFLRFLDARNWRVAVIESKRTLAVYDSAGSKLWSRAGVTGVAGGWVMGGSVVLQQQRLIRAYSRAAAGIGRQLPRGASVDGAIGGLVVYKAGSSVHLLRLSDGRDRKFVTVKGLVQAQITTAGVFYAAGSSVTFVPMRVALQTLR